jgi:hypothetical protein
METRKGNSLLHQTQEGGRGHQNSGLAVTISKVKKAMHRARDAVSRELGQVEGS